MSGTEDKLSHFIAEELLEEGGPGKGDPLAGDEVDSLGLEQLVKHIEVEFDVAVDDEEMVLENFESIGALARFVNSKRARNDSEASR